MRKFEKISYEQFQKDVKDDLELYNSYSLPKRKTKHSAAYDIASLIDYDLKPKEAIILPTGLKCACPEDEFLMIVLRSSLGYKHGIKMANQVGIIDADYYNNESNEGHFFVKLENNSDKIFPFKKGEAFVQAIFLKYQTVDDEEEIIEERKGGFGSTSEKQ